MAASAGVPVLTPVLEMLVRVSDPVVVEPHPGEPAEIGQRRETHILGGKWRVLDGAAEALGEGPAGLTGAVVSGGADQQLVRADGTIEIDARYELSVVGAGAEDGASAADAASSSDVVSVHASGVRRPQGEGVYFRVAMSFASVDPRLEPLTRSLFIADGVREADEVRHTVYLVG